VGSYGAAEHEHVQAMRLRLFSESGLDHSFGRRLPAELRAGERTPRTSWPPGANVVTGRTMSGRSHELVQYVQFGSAGVRVSRIALGMGLRGQANEAEIERLIQSAFDRGVNLFDCANVYG